MKDIDNSHQNDPTGVKKILIVEDDESIGEFLIQAIQQETPYQAVLATNGFQALQLLQSQKVDLIILDYNLPDMNGLQFYDTIRAIKALERLPVLIVTAEAKSIQKEFTKRQLPQLKKPFELIELIETIEQFLT